jgi:RNA polymerase sigma-70 factor (ECF subfamily)
MLTKRSGNAMANGAEVARSSGLSRRDAPLARAAAFRELADRHLAASYRLARAILGDGPEAEDATHDAFETAWRAWGTLRDVERFERWFDRILVNTCRNRLRRRRAVELVRDISPSIAVDPGAAVAGAQDRDEIGRAIATLSPDHRIVLALRFYRDLPVSEIAARTGVPVGTVKSRLHHAVLEMRRALCETAEATR